MNPSDPGTFDHRLEKLPTGRSYHFVDQKPQNYEHGKTITLLLVHGFPDLGWYVHNIPSPESILKAERTAVGTVGETRSAPG